MFIVSEGRNGSDESKASRQASPITVDNNKMSELQMANKPDGTKTNVDISGPFLNGNVNVGRLSLKNLESM